MSSFSSDLSSLPIRPLSSIRDGFHNHWLFNSIMYSVGSEALEYFQKVLRRVLRKTTGHHSLSFSVRNLALHRHGLSEFQNLFNIFYCVHNFFLSDKIAQRHRLL